MYGCVCGKEMEMVTINTCDSVRADAVFKRVHKSRKEVIYNRVMASSIHNC